MKGVYEYGVEVERVVGFCHVGAYCCDFCCGVRADDMLKVEKEGLP